MALFALRGRPAEAPWRLAVITVLPSAVGLSDRQAGEAVRRRIDWTYALGLALDDPGFRYSVGRSGVVQADRLAEALRADTG